MSDTRPRPWTPAGTRNENLTAEEFATVAHVREWTHDSTQCWLCAAGTRALAAERVRQLQVTQLQVVLDTQRTRAVRAEITNAYLARDLEDTQRRLDSIIEG